MRTITQDTLTPNASRCLTNTRIAAAADRRPRYGAARLAAAAATILLSGELSASIIETSAVGVFLSLDGQESQDFSNPVASVSRSRDIAGPGGEVDVLEGRAIQNANGFSSVGVNVSYSGIPVLAANGTLDERNMDAIANRQVTYTNTGSTTAYAGIFDFTLSGMMLEVFNGGGGPTIPKATISFLAAVTGGPSLDGTMTLVGEYNSFYTEDVQNLSGSVVRGDCFMEFCQRGTVNLDNFSGALNLGTLAPGASVTITTALTVSAIFNGTELGAMAEAVDPSGASYYSATFTAIDGGDPTPNPVPSPAAAWLFLPGLGALILRRQRSRPRNILLS
jgi:hypothetical protein